MKMNLNLTLLALVALSASACNGSGDQANANANADAASLSASPATPSASPDAPIAPVAPRTYEVGALVFNGSGTAASDTASILDILDSKDVSYRVVSSAQMNAITAEELRTYGTIIWPGGLANTMSNSLTAATRERIRTAIVEDGVGYVGFCAGAFITGTYGSWGLNLTPHDFPYYYLEYQGVVTEMVEVKFNDGSTRDLVWYGGPELADFGKVVARYPDGTTAIAQERIGKGLVVISGPHPEAPQGWRAGLNDSDGMDLDIAWNMIDAAMTQAPML